MRPWVAIIQFRRWFVNSFSCLIISLIVSFFSFIKDSFETFFSFIKDSFETFFSFIKDSFETFRFNDYEQINSLDTAFSLTVIYCKHRDIFVIKKPYMSRPVRSYSPSKLSVTSRVIIFPVEAILCSEPARCLSF
ncbi:hypothetical protein EBL85_16725 [Marichromatium sp. AB32]|nr:hypothetical protein EBL85_16725 [Marichromatium sp. AB32]